MRTGIIYRYLNIESGKSYVGQTVNPYKRFNQHLNSNNKDWHVDYHKNPEKYEYIVVEDNIPEDQLDEREVYWIDYYDSYNNGYNLTEGGCGNRGYKLSYETKKKISKSNKGKHRSDETKKKISESSKGKHLSEEHKIKISESMKGKNAYWYGKHHSEEHKRKISESMKGKPKTKLKKPIIQYSKSGDFIKEWNSLSEAAEYFNKSPGNISICLKGRNNSAYGYVWKYK